MRRRRLLWLAALLSVCTLLVYGVGRAGFRSLVAHGIEWRFETVEHLSVDVAVDRRAEHPKPLFLDVRSRAEFLAGHIRGARWFPTKSAAMTAISTLPAEQPIIVYCSVGWRSSVMVERLQAAGRGAVSNLRGGLFEWVVRGREVVRAQGPTQKIHPYGAPWSWLLPSDQRARP